jgi:hypothetical protein
MAREVLFHLDEYVLHILTQISQSWTLNFHKNQDYLDYLHKLLKEASFFFFFFLNLVDA